MKKMIVASLLACISYANAQTANSSGAVLSSSTGRFVFGQISDYKSDQFMLDTQTGRVWQIVCILPDKDAPSLCGKRALSQIQYIDALGNLHPAPSPMK